MGTMTIRVPLRSAASLRAYNICWANNMADHIIYYTTYSHLAKCPPVHSVLCCDSRELYGNDSHEGYRIATLHLHKRAGF